MNAYEAMKNYGRGTIFSKISTLLHITYFYIRLLHVSYTFHSTFFFLIFSSFLRTTRFDRLQIINKGQKWWLTRFELLIFFLIKNKKKKKTKKPIFHKLKEKLHCKSSNKLPPHPSYPILQLRPRSEKKGKGKDGEISTIGPGETLTSAQGW